MIISTLFIMSLWSVSRICRSLISENIKNQRWTRIEIFTFFSDNFYQYLILSRSLVLNNIGRNCSFLCDTFRILEKRVFTIHYLKGQINEFWKRYTHAAMMNIKTKNSQNKYILNQFSRIKLKWFLKTTLQCPLHPLKMIFQRKIQNRPI